MIYARKARPAAGFTMTELLVVLVIISILATLAVPVYVNKAERAKVAAAQQDVRQLAEAEEACASLHGFYVPLQVLDDVPMAPELQSDTDAINNETGLYLIDPNNTLATLALDQPKLDVGTTDQRVHDLIAKWEGPFINFQHYYTGNLNTNDQSRISGTYQLLDYPLDPWGNPYRFYSPLGVIGSEAAQTQLTALANASFSDGRVTSTDDRFDRFTIVSYGPDGVPDKVGSQNSDDIIYYFGMLPGGNRNETNY